MAHGWTQLKTFKSLQKTLKCSQSRCRVILRDLLAVATANRMGHEKMLSTQPDYDATVFDSKEALRQALPQNGQSVLYA